MVHILKVECDQASLTTFSTSSSVHSILTIQACLILDSRDPRRWTGAFTLYAIYFMAVLAVNELGAVSFRAFQKLVLIGRIIFAGLRTLLHFYFPSIGMINVCTYGET